MNQLEKMVWSLSFVLAWTGSWRLVKDGMDLGKDGPRRVAVESADKVVLDLRKHLETNGGRLHHSDELEAERLEEEL